MNEWASCVSRMAAGDRAALDELHVHAERYVKTIVRRIVRNEAEVEEVANDVFQQAWRLAAHYDPARCNATAWIGMMARSRAVDRRRKVSARDRTMEPLPVEMAGPDAQLMENETRQAVLASLQRLPLEQRQAIELAFFEGLSHADVATRVGLPLGTVKTRIRLGMIKMRDELPEFAKGAGN